MNCQYNYSNNNDDIKETLERIIELQKKEVKKELQEKFCDYNVLGYFDDCRKECNTRPIQLFTSDDVPWKCPIERNEDGCNPALDTQSCVFRVERVKGGCVTLRALVENGLDDNGYKIFNSTNSYITVKLSCICALRCLRDTFVNLCIH